MLIRFLQTTASENPEYPFHAGQVISVACPSPFLLSLLDGVRAEAVRTQPDDLATAPAYERPEPTRRRRGRHAKH
jgi:hypothetical protein